METNVPKMVEEDCFNGIKVSIEYLGQFRFARMNMYDEDGNLLYYLTKEISPKSLPDERVPRREYLEDGKFLMRKYVGWKKSFIEFCRKLKEYEIRGIPQGSDYYRAAMELKLSMSSAVVYAGCYEKLFKKSNT
jgi:hypothetical protein